MKMPLFAAVISAGVLLGGCGLTPWGAPPLTPEEAQTIRYPGDLKPAEPLEIEVIRKYNQIILDNRTTRSYANAQIWLNQEFGATVEEIPVGRSEPISLKLFYNRYGERYPLGRFLQPDADRPLVAADLLTEGKLHKLVVRLKGDWRRP